MGKIYKNGILFAGSTDSAKSVAFDNTDTGLEADNVQEAIEEVKNDVAEINSNLLNPFTVDANGYPVAKICSSTIETDILTVFSKLNANTFWIGFLGDGSTKSFCIIARQDHSNRGCFLRIATHVGRLQYHLIENGEIKGDYTINITSNL